MSDSGQNLGTENSQQELQSALEPTHKTNVAGYATPLMFSISEENQSQLSQLASKILEDPLLQWKLGERVYQLLKEDISRQKERSRNYGSRF